MSLARDASNISVEAAAELVGVAPPIWLAWENDRSAPFADLMPQLADLLNVSLAWLLSGRGTGPCWRAQERYANTPSSKATSSIDNVLEMKRHG
ncbi:helix-turn-helix domain-containing protein [Rhizobium sullae]|uniref:helix-turn-helix domain-containing protein n=1 Tax=Rhizobium sullae TaxID=50338 RepID=UPI003CC81F76